MIFLTLIEISLKDDTLDECFEKLDIKEISNVIDML